MAIAAQQSRSERDQEVKANKAEPQSDAHLPPSITPQGRSRPLSRGESSAHGAAGDKGAREPTPDFSSGPPPAPAPGHACSISSVSPHPSQGAGDAAGEPGGLRSLASPSVGREKEEEFFQCLVESSLANLWCLSGG